MNQYLFCDEEYLLDSILITKKMICAMFYELLVAEDADNDIFGMIMNGDVAYELCRPLSVYTMWFSRNVGGRMAETLLRCVPVLFCAFLMPEPYRMTLPVNMAAFGWFLFTMFLGI